MRHLISERKIALAFLLFATGVILVSQASLFAQPVLISEKGLFLLILGVGLILSGVFVAMRSVRKVK